MDNVLNIIAQEFIGSKISEFKNIIELDRKLLSLEKETAINRGKLSEKANEKEQIEIMQRKGNLGMNAVLSVSLAVARLIAHIQGKDLWQLLRDGLEETLAKTIMAYGGFDLLSEVISPDEMKKLKSGGESNWQVLKGELTLEDLVQGLQRVEAKLKKENVKLYDVLRKQMPVYGVAE